MFCYKCQTTKNLEQILILGAPEGRSRILLPVFIVAAGNNGFIFPWSGKPLLLAATSNNDIIRNFRPIKKLEKWTLTLGIYNKAVYYILMIVYSVLSDSF